MRQLIKSLFPIFLVFVLLPGCSEEQQPPPSSTSIPTSADIVLRNAYVYTVDNQQSIQQAVAIRGNEIIYVGSNEGVLGELLITT